MMILNRKYSHQYPHQVAEAGRRPLLSRRGQSIIEFVFVGIPMLFVLISIFEMSRGMWMYGTLAHAARRGVRFASVHGINCVPNPPGVTNDCTKTIAQIATEIRNAGVGLDPAITTVNFTVLVGTGQAATSTCTLSNCPGTIWPPSTNNANQVGQRISISLVTPFRSGLAMFWPGSSPTTFGLINLPASSTDSIHY
ncbi:MAG: TadE family protein [Bryobacteraceae bacterium]